VLRNFRVFLGPGCQSSIDETDRQTDERTLDLYMTLTAYYVKRVNTHCRHKIIAETTLVSILLLSAEVRHEMCLQRK